MEHQVEQDLPELWRLLLVQDPFGAPLTSLMLGFAGAASLLGAAAAASFLGAGAVSGSRYAAQAANSYFITIQAGIGDPEAIARAVEDVVRQSYQRGTSSTGLLAV